MTTALNVGIEGIRPPVTYLQRLDADSLIYGAPSAKWWAKQALEMQFRFDRTLRAGLAQNLTTDEIVKQVRAQLEISARAAHALVRTSTQQVAADARREMFQRNDDVISGIKHVSHFDERTTDICIGYGSDSATGDGAEYDLNYEPINGTKLPYNGGVPRHWQCRSVEVAITKSWKELGLEAPEGWEEEIPMQSGEDWMREQPKEVQDELLGKTRAALWRGGKVSLLDLLDQQGNALSASELTAKYVKPATAARAASAIELSEQDVPALVREVGTEYVVTNGRETGGDIEYAYVTKSSGEPLFYRKGDVRSVTFTPEERMLFTDNPGSIFIHNHPGSVSLSDADVITARSQRMSRMIAAGNDGESRYEVHFLPSTVVTVNELVVHFSRANAFLQSNIFGWAYQNQNNIITADRAHWHFLQQLVAHFDGYEYTATLSKAIQAAVDEVTMYLANRWGVSANEVPDAMLKRYVGRIG